MNKYTKIIVIMTGMVIAIIYISFIRGLLRKLVVFVKFTLIFYQT